MAISQTLGISQEEAMEIEENYYKMFKGISSFKAKGSKYVRTYGHVVMCRYTGHKMYWWDHDRWLERQRSFTPEFWEVYRSKHKGTGDAIAMEVKQHFQAAAKWDRMALNSVTQGTGIIILKSAMTSLFHWIVQQNYFNIIKIVALVHDEACIEYPKELGQVDKILSTFMEKAAAKFCKSLPIPAEASVGTYWIH